MENKKPTKTQIEILMNDWFRNIRQKDTFIHKDTRNSIKGTEKTELSRYIVGQVHNSDILEVIANSRKIAQNVVDSMTAAPVRVLVGGDSSATTGKVINVSTKYFDDSRLSLQHKVNLLIGFSIHEACHINHTDFEGLRANLENIKNPQVQMLKKDIINIIEDERIEYLLGDSEHPEGDAMPGFSEFIACCKEYTFGKYSDGLTEDIMKEPINRFLNTFLSVVRFPSMLTEEIIESQYQYLTKIKDILTPFPLSQRGVFEAADKIMNVISEIIKDELKKEQEQKKKQQNQQNNADSTSGSSGSGNSKSPSKKEIQNRLEETLNKDAVKELLKKIEESIDMPEDNNGQNTCKEMANNQNAQQFANGDAERMTAKIGNGPNGGHARTAYLKKVNGNKNAYDEALKSVKQFIPAMSKSLRCRTEDRDYELRGMKSGKLNTNKLVTLKTGNHNIFTKSGSSTCDSACVCILIDESGSMSRRVKPARSAAILINEAVKRIPNLEFFAYGFTDNEMNVYCERNKADKYALGSTRASGGTPTGTAMNIAAQKIRKMTQSSCLMLVLTDGAPDNKNDVRVTDSELRRQNIIPVGVGISGAPVKGLFQDAVEIEDLSTLAPELGRLMKKKLLKSLKVKENI